MSCVDELPRQHLWEIFEFCAKRLQVYIHTCTLEEHLADCCSSLNGRLSWLVCGYGIDATIDCFIACFSGCHLCTARTGTLAAIPSTFSIFWLKYSTSKIANATDTYLCDPQDLGHDMVMSYDNLIIIMMSYGCEGGICPDPEFTLW